MRKKIQTFLLLICICIPFVQTNAQVFGENIRLWTMGYGLGPIYENLGLDLQASSMLSNLNISTSGTLYGKVEFSIDAKAGIGLNMSYVKRTYNYNYKVSDGNNGFLTYWEEDTYSSFSLLLRLNVHSKSNDKLDVFIGTGLGYNPSNYSRASDNPNGTSGIGGPRNNNSNSIGFELTFGGRYFISPSLGFYAEVGYSKTIMQVGISGKF